MGEVLSMTRCHSSTELMPRLQSYVGPLKKPRQVPPSRGFRTVRTMWLSFAFQG
jgi:hypothetical protein